MAVLGGAAYILRKLTYGAVLNKLERRRWRPPKAMLRDATPKSLRARVRPGAAARKSSA